MDKLIITPKTKIYDLLEDYPELEGLLIASAPQFKKLQNPLLKRTIAKITTLSQAATIGGINVEELVNKLREKVGQTEELTIEDSGDKYNTEKPEGFSPGNIALTIDIRDMLHAGEQPVHEVLSSLKKLKADEILEVIAPFIPAPLIDKSTSLGYKHWIMDNGTEEFRVYFFK